MQHDFESHNVAFKTPWITIYEKDTWYALTSSTGLSGGGAIILDRLNRVILIQIYRYPINQVVLEIPRGATDPDEGGNPTGVALREANEETGVDLTGARIIDLGLIHPDDGILSYENQLCAAILPHPFGKIDFDADEVLGFRIFPFDTVKEMICRGEINDSHTIAAVFRLDAILAQEAALVP